VSCGRRTARTSGALLAFGALAVCFDAPVRTYLADQHYQSHFLFLWAFFAAALWRSGRGSIAWRAPRGPRRACGLASATLGVSLLHVGLATGSSTVQRAALVATFAAWALLAAASWSARRCLGYAAFAVLCFGVPYSAYYQLAALLRAATAWVLTVVPRVLPVPFTVEGLELRFPDYRLAITEDCSGFNQLVTFFGLAFLAVLTGCSGARRVLGLFALGAALACAANLARVLGFAALVSAGWHEAIDDDALHAAIGFSIYAPFILCFVLVIAKTHRDRVAARPAIAAAGFPVIALLVPLLAVRALHWAEPETDPTPPPYFTELAPPPGYELVMRAPSEAHERAVYDTPWLINASFARGADGFELFAFLTRSRRHLAVHQIANCLDAAGEVVVYGPPVEIAGRTFWSLELRGRDAVRHGYFAFWVDGRDADDSLSTQLAVFAQRLRGLREVGLTRILLPGPLVLPPPPGDLEILGTRARQLAAARPTAAAVAD
jgi:exosortase/archaeosortase family protein